MDFRAFFTLFLLILIPGCGPMQQPLVTRTLNRPAAPSCAPQKPVCQEAPAITIWVHGTRFFPEPILKRFFYCKEGLHHYTSLDPSYRHHKLAQTLSESDPDHFQAEHFYLFGWSGALSFKEREKAARRLYEQITKLRADYLQKYGKEPIIRIISHSHGGNVVLLLVKVKDPADMLIIDELILLAVPVQEETKEFASDPLFKKIYSLYSYVDTLQVVDPQGWQCKKSGCPLFSERKFPHHEKICQCAIKCNNRSIMHIEFIKGSFLRYLPQILAELEIWREEIKLNSGEWSMPNKCLNIISKKTRRS